MLSRADSVGVFQVESRAQMSMLPRLKPGMFLRSRDRGRDRAAGPDPGRHGASLSAPARRHRQGATIPPRVPAHGTGRRIEGRPQTNARRAAVPGTGDADRHHRRKVHARRGGRTAPRHGDLPPQRQRASVPRQVHRRHDHARLRARVSPRIVSARSKVSANTAFRKATRRASRCWSMPRPGSNAAIPTCSAPPSSTASRWAFISRRNSCAMRASTTSRSARPTSISAIGIARWSRAPTAGMPSVSAFASFTGSTKTRSKKLIAARGNGFASIERLAAIAGISRFTIERLAEADAFRSLCDARPARRIVGGAPARRDRRPSATPAAPAKWIPPRRTDVVAAADAASERRAFPGTFRHASGNGALRARRRGLRGDRPVAERASGALFPRPPHRARRHAQCAASQRRLAQDTLVTVAGLVLVRQRPGTAKGVIFMTLEDETDIANIIVWPKAFEKNRRTVMTARFLAVRGRLQRAGLVIHVVAEKFLRSFRGAANVAGRSAAKRRRSVFTQTVRRAASAGYAASAQEPRFSLSRRQSALPTDFSEHARKPLGKRPRIRRPIAFEHTRLIEQQMRRILLERPLVLAESRRAQPPAGAAD